MKKLEKQFKFRKNTYVQLEEGNNYYLYGVWNLKEEAVGEPSYYEIFKKKVRQEETIKGVFYPEREQYPCDEAFGNWAWCCGNMERVEFIKKEKSLF